MISPELNTVTMVRRYFFHIVKGNVRVTDRVGVELREETMMSREIANVIKERWPGTTDGAPWHGWWVEIVDPDGDVVRTISLDDMD